MPDPASASSFRAFAVALNCKDLPADPVQGSMLAGIWDMKVEVTKAPQQGVDFEVRAVESTQLTDGGLNGTFFIQVKTALS